MQKYSSHMKRNEITYFGAKFEVWHGVRGARNGFLVGQQLDKLNSGTATFQLLFEVLNSQSSVDTLFLGILIHIFIL